MESDWMGNITRYTYDKQGNLATATDASGNTTSYSYDPYGHLISMIDAAGNTWTYVYNNESQMTKTTSAMGAETSSTYDALGRQTAVTDPLEHTTTYLYDAKGQVIGIIQKGNTEVSYTYDANGRLVKTVDKEGCEIDSTYDAMDRVVTITDARNGVTRYTYTDRGEVAAKTDAEGYVTSYEYDGNGNCVKMTTVDGDTIYEYDPLDRLIKTTTPDGASTSLTYDGVGNVVETIDALGTSALFEYDEMSRLTATKLHRVDTQDNVDEWEITLYEFDGRGLVTKQVDALGNVTTYAYDGNGNLVSKTDPDGYTTEYTYNALDLVTAINYNDAKEVSYRYNKTGDLVSMTDWLGTTTFELDLLHQLTAATDHKGNRVEYTYDGVGNQTEILYPDGTKATYEYDLVHNQTKVTETDGSETTYAYDGMARVTEMRYPNGWVEYYTYDKMGRLLAVDDTHPSEKPAKTQKHTYRYDANGNMTYEYMRGNGTGQAKNETLYTYDALNRLITAHDNYGNSTRTYTYDSLGNLTYETGNGSHNCDYIYNNLNQQVDRSSDNWKSHTASTYDNRGNLILEQYGKNKKLETAGEYTYDETNKMVRGVNGNAEESIYTYNGLGALMENTWIIAKNGYGYHDVSGEEDTTTPTNPTPDVPDPGETTDPDTPDPGETTDPDTPDDGDDTDPGVNNNGNGNNNGNNGNHYGNGNGNGNNGNGNGNGNGNKGNGNGNNSADSTETAAADTGTLTASLVAYGNAGNGNNGNNGNGNGNQDKPTGSDVKKTSTVVKQFVVDFSSETYKPLMEHEVNGLDYRYVYSDKARLSVVVQGIENGSASLLDDKGELHAYYHCDYLGTTDYLTSAVNSKVISWTSYSEWGEITHNAVLKCGQRELDLVKEYATHDFDAVLNLYYAKARFYDADNRRFTAVDPILDPSRYDLREYVTDPMQLVQYLYVADNAVIRVDLLGEKYSLKEGTIAHIVITAYIEGLYPGTIADTTLYGVKANKSGRGRPDIVIPVKNTYHVYEVKSDQYISWWTYQQSAYRQLEKYINALHSGDDRNNENYPLAKTAKKGTVLNWENHIILPYIADTNKVIETWTNNNTPGMIYYKIRDREKRDEVESEEFVTPAVRARIGYYAMIACEDPPEDELNLVNVDTYGDLELNSDVIEWLDNVVVSRPPYTDAQAPYEMIEYPDGTKKYKALSRLEMIIGREYTYRQLLDIYDNKAGWANTIPQSTSGGTIPVVPIDPVMPTIPVFPPVPAPVPAFA